MLPYVFRRCWTKRDTDRGNALFHSISSLSLFALWFTLRLNYRMDTALQFGIFFGLLGVFYIARGSLGVTKPTDATPTMAQQRQVQYFKSLFFAAVAIFLLYRGIMFALNDKPEGCAIRLLIAALAIGIALFTFPFAKTEN